MSGTSDGSVSENNLTIHNQSTVNQTFHRTFGRDTVEVVPMEHYYRNADTLRSVNPQEPYFKVCLKARKMFIHLNRCFIHLF